jgi:hypothetical protein
MANLWGGSNGPPVFFGADHRVDTGGRQWLGVTGWVSMAKARKSGTANHVADIALRPAGE